MIKQLNLEIINFEQDKAQINSIIDKIDKAKRENDTISLIDLDYLRTTLNPVEFSIVEKVFAINPETYGFKGPYLGLETVPDFDSFIKVDKQPYSYKGENKYTNVQHIPRHVYFAYRSMADAMSSELGRPLIIESGYRSSAYQVIVFLDVLKSYNFDLQKTAQRVAVPGYSEHGLSTSLAIDFQNIDGLPSEDSPTGFETTQEYDWLIKNAHKFGFFLSYPKDNRYGVKFEPWHWRYMPDEKIIL